MDLSPLIAKPTYGSAGETGRWRNYRPVINTELCIKCGECMMYCPEGVISKNLIINYTYCKGCGVCREVCIQKAIVMMPE
ncbi:4Fe-4S binding protein [Archaeoglobus neptunius]|uniref:4Fe-4S binding protein n=1 Tax=Archaeoglobus neptunius TaxID=2798580 RepID=UPI0019257A27|nr:4Fe-4S binding protein [Archaeoglobus neptunius]